MWTYVIRYNNNEDDLALLDKKRYGKNQFTKIGVILIRDIVMIVVRKEI